MPLTIRMGMVLLVIRDGGGDVASLLLVRRRGVHKSSPVRMRWRNQRQSCGNSWRKACFLGRGAARQSGAAAPQALHVLIHGLSGGSPDGGLPFMRRSTGVAGVHAGVTVLASLLFSLAPMAQFQTKAGGSDRGAGRQRRRRSLQFRLSCVASADRVQPAVAGGRGTVCANDENLRNVDAGFRDRSSAGRSIWIRCWRVILRRELRRWSSGRSIAVTALPGVSQREVQRTTSTWRATMFRATYWQAGIRPSRTKISRELPWVSNDYLQTLGFRWRRTVLQRRRTATSEKLRWSTRKFAQHFYGSPQAALGRVVSRREGRGRRRRLWAWCAT